MRIEAIKPNMTEVIFQDGSSVLFSYETPVAACKDYKLYKTRHKWSKTTTRHINQWLEGRQAEEAEQEFFDNLVKGI
jgi:hypothetical protein